jgi:septal ring factor EnvC (AmiA/AmiB activator)
MMKCGQCSLVLLLVLGLVTDVQARFFGRISPALDTQSSKAFFKKDYPDDRRPQADALHFGHPYPVVQDSGEFDKDFVKDENGDNGHWQAQQEYDRLRHKLRTEKKEAAQALEKRQEEEQELKRVMEKYDKKHEEHQEAIAEKQAAIKEPEKARKPEVPVKPKVQQAQESSSWSWSWWPFSWPKWSMPEMPEIPESGKAAKPAKQSSGVNEAGEDTEKEMDDLKKCKDELAKAKAKLEKLMDELEKAKAKQAEADATLASATEKQGEAKQLAETLHEKSTEEEAEHNTAREAYLKQQKLVLEMKADLDAAAAKVKAYRDAEDANGGVYNTHSSAKSLSAPTRIHQLLGPLLVAAVAWHAF